MINKKDALDELIDNLARPILVHRYSYPAAFHEIDADWNRAMKKSAETRHANARREIAELICEWYDQYGSME